MIRSRRELARLAARFTIRRGRASRSLFLSLSRARAESRCVIRLTARPGRELFYPNESGQRYGTPGNPPDAMRAPDEDGVITPVCPCTRPPGRRYANSITRPGKMMRGRAAGTHTHTLIRLIAPFRTLSDALLRSVGGGSDRYDDERHGSFVLI